MINLTNLQLRVYEVETKFFNDEGEHYDSESEYVVIDPTTTPDPACDAVAATLKDLKPQNVLVCVYEARTADFHVELDKSGELEFEAGDIDCSTGYSGSPILELFYDKEGNICEPVEA